MAKHPGFKEASEKATNGLFAELHPAWKNKTPLQVALESALSRGGSPQFGVTGAPQTTSFGQ